jgi:hypothetical protein
MNNNISIEQFLESKDNSIISRTKKSPLKAIILIFSGLFILVLNSQLHFESQSFMFLFLMMIAFSLSIWGIMEGIFRKYYFILTDNKKKLKTSEYYFENKDRDKLISIMNTKNFSELKLLKPSNHDGLKLKLMKTEDARICFTQVIAYVPYEFVNATAVYELVGNEAQLLVESLQRK